ncbi:hypothetical protein BMS3Abin17_00221 [archaeon BMS3Abin17]|nr:hypothetical protein BMS3Abin17_00221 [archaeon BMS3Abin17]HDZ60789.1 hypothetical protein [Candidatus Pacearchaeota archaeon]
MRKKAVKKKSVSVKSKKNLNVEQALIDNFISLQKVMVNLSVKFGNLTTQISKLLDLFENSAKALTEKDFTLEKESKETKKISDKIDTMLEQNKIIARGLTLLHEPQTHERPPPLPKQASQSMPPRQSADTGEYQKSISSKYPKLPKP